MNRRERIEWAKQASTQRAEPVCVHHPEGPFVEAFTFERGALIEYAKKATWELRGDA